MASTQLKNQHLMWRAGFGPAASQVEQLKSIPPTQLYKALQQASSKKPAYIDVANDYLKGLFMGAGELGRQERKKDLDTADRKKIREQNRDDLKSLNLYWLNEMVQSDAQLREKMAFFWHGHFASRNINIFFQQQLLDIIRQNALGNFRTLLLEVSKSGAMLNFLNAQQNKKDHPNENFAREVMELFTMGRGHYTEQDVKEAARAFTGWGATAKGEFVFRKFQHDRGTKSLFGKTGNFEGEDVLDLILDQKQTAKFITEKIYRFFVNDIVDKEKTDWLANRFYTNDYDIGRLLEDIFTSDWFYEDKNIGTRIKSPIELLAGIQRILPMQLENEESLLVLQRLLGQLLFYPPNVAGWPGGKTWIDSSTLMLRLRIPQLINDRDDLNVTPKIDDDQMMGKEDNGTGKSAQVKMGKGNKPIYAAIEWEPYLKNFESVPRDYLMQNIAGIVLQAGMQAPAELVKMYIDTASRENFIKTATLQLMSLPEYQMC
ncbi:MAG TPA: DUF1800 domain-containing protein [Flavisolibacter sp.]|nr:DUF1800 domain-containing protein [Flavisolibacter sp.]